MWLQSYCENSHYWAGVNQMWILNNYKDCYIQSRSLSHEVTLKDLTLLYLYSTLIYSKLKDRLNENSTSNKTLSYSDIIKLFYFQIDNVIIMFSGRVFFTDWAFVWVLTVPLFSPTCFFIHMKKIFIEALLQKQTEAPPILI